MPSILCANCQAKLKYNSAHQGHKIACPSCGQPVKIPDAIAPASSTPVPADLDQPSAAQPPGQSNPTTVQPSPATTPPTSSPPRPTTPMLSNPRAKVWPTVFTIVGSLLVLMGFVAMGSGREFSGRMENSRFASDNAYGATANALEYMARELRLFRPTELWTCGLLCFLVAGVGRLREAVERR